MNQPQKVSVHGGHSGQFCSHASDTLEDIVKAYIAKGFSWVGLTEHMPAAIEHLRYPDEQELDQSPEFLEKRLADYFQEARRLKSAYSDQIDIYVAMETEAWSGYRERTAELVAQYRPEYLVGSVHHVDDIGIDFNPREYQRAAASQGGIEQLYCRYFDLQLELIEELRPAVVGHFDLIRIFDDNYQQRLKTPQIWKKVERNLARIAELGLILDYNLRAMFKGAKEAYPTRDILILAGQLGIAVVPGDDSHSIATTGACYDQGMQQLTEAGLSTTWLRPRCMSY